MSVQTVDVMRHEDVLRELNLHPLWQLRMAHTVDEVLTAPVIEQPVIEQKADRDVDLPGPENQQAVADCSRLGWAELKKQVKDCHACSLRAGCVQTVFGGGDSKAGWLFVGSWPTEDDENTGDAFSGQPGQLLDNMLAAIGLKRNAGVFLSNVVKCCGSIRRGPAPEQIAQCQPYLQRQIQLLQPRLIVVLGHSAATAMLGRDSEWASLLGKTHAYATMDEQGNERTVPMVITHHPAALLHSPLNKAQAWKDLCFARDTMRQLQKT